MSLVALCGNAGAWSDNTKLTFDATGSTGTILARMNVVSTTSSVDFSSNNYWVEIRVTRTSTAGTAPFLQSIKIY